MLKITPYLGIIVVIVCFGGIWYPLLGYVVALVFALILIISPFRGRWFCGNLCPRGSFNDFWVAKITRNKPIPAVFRSMPFRILVFAGLMGFMGIRLIQTAGMIDKIGMVFVTMCTMTTSVALIFGTITSPRAWCSFCPMGTLARFLGKGKYQLILDLEKCIDCKKCVKVCPMQLNVNDMQEKPDCLKCGRCVEACPKQALRFE